MRRWLVLVVVIIATAVGCSSSSTRRAAPPTSTTVVAAGGAALLALHATRGSDPGIFDSQGRQVILRGVNVNSLADYYQDDPKLPTVVPVTDADWASMAAHGFDVVRLLVSWSKLEPQRGVVDDRYVERIADTVHAAARHGIYTVIDMHQDAWGKYIASPMGVHCTNGGTPAIGWDGAPDWATLTNGADTCAHGSREMSEAVETAWDKFYANSDGIMSFLVETWAHVAARFASDPDVVGYDLINEPNHGHDTNGALRGLASYYQQAIAEIRTVESRAHGFHHIAFFEDTVFGATIPPSSVSADTNIVFAPHNYGESIGNIPIEGEFDFFAASARAYRTAMWIGEYGWFSDPAANASKVARFAAKADALLDAGEAWWQWRQACGDPHSVGKPGGTPAAVIIQFQNNGCPGDHNQGVNPQWQCTWRPYPRATPGHLTSLKTNCTTQLAFTGVTTKPGTVDIWFPNARAAHVDGLTHASSRTVPGGARITGTVQGHYDVSVRAA